ncbi:SRPBCC family protein [Ancylobacter lacus]|uniref:SRPBCC family protein n=1 Tax=Ancylobacter lacus TaxID=2579970 RepID=UPI001BCB7863|nr:SRPBCC family protein [Ancylobacter lacus]MBS7538859.1 SRPBCC family protein [Ancylobacter lacus]
MIERLLAAVLLTFACFAPAEAHGPTPQKVEESVIIPAPPEAVWKVLGAFGGIAGWHPLVKQASATGGDAPGAERVLTLATGEITDGLDDYSAAERRYAYRLSKENIEALPVSFYTAEIQVKDAPGGSEVVWIARFYRADTTNEPPDNLNDEAAIAAMTTFFRAGLEGLKAKVTAP